MDTGQEKLSLLNAEDLAAFPPERGYRSQRSWRNHHIPIVVHALLIAAYTTIFAIWTREHWAPTSNSASTFRAIDGLSITFESQPRDLYESSIYAGPPNNETDDAWNKLLEPMNIRVSEEELSKNREMSVPLPENGGYLAWLGVFHELHCVKLLRQWKYKDHYYSHLTEKEAVALERHTDHCLDRIRAYLMCHPDVSSIATFFWDAEAAPKVNGSKTLHQCVDWTQLMESMQSRQVGTEEFEALENPNRS